MGSLSGDLPNELVEEILLKLPAPFILSFKRVCKSWYNLLSSPCFLHLHSRNPHSSSQPFALFHPSSHKKSPIFTISLKHHEHIMQLSEVPHCSPWMPRSIKCGNDILCILTNRGAFCIVNPATGQSTCLPHIHGLRVVNFGFYFNPQNCKFKVLAMLSVRFIGGYKVFDSSIGKWVEPIKPLIFSSQELKSIGHTCYMYNRLNTRERIGFEMLKEGLNSIGHTGSMHNHFDTVELIGFDMLKEEVEIIPAPPKFLRECDDHVAVMEWDGGVSLAAVSLNLELRLWALRKEKKWEKVVDADLGELGLKRKSENSYPYPKIVVGKDILMVYGDKMVSYGIESGKLNSLLSSEEGLCDGNFLSYKPTFLSWDYDAGEKEKESKGGKKKRNLAHSCPTVKRKKTSCMA
ncbi:hypothetical protein AMTRI_Chr12g267590 [Amborella trichopoda]